MNKELITVNIASIVQYRNNPRKNQKAIEPLADGMKQVGYLNPIVVDENNVILAGHTRLMALKKMGVKEVQVLKVEGLDEEQKKKYRLMDNKSGELAEWDTDLLKEELAKVDFGKLELDWGVPLEEKHEHKCPHCGWEF